MRAEEFVKIKYPRARAERYKTNGPFGKSYYLIWSDFKQTTRLGEGDTKSKAWTNARKNLESINS